MLNQWIKRLSGKRTASTEIPAEASSINAPALIAAPGVEPFDLAAALNWEQQLPVPDWHALGRWAAVIPEPSAQGSAWAEAEVAWLAHLQGALGPRYSITQLNRTLLLSTLEPRLADATVQFTAKTLARVTKVLEGVAQAPVHGHSIVLVFEDEDTYYRYVSRYYPQDGEFALSSGMHINAGCSHFVTFQAELRAIEPVIAHELTHACLAHLAIPAWLNEGLAVNTERRLSPPAYPTHTPQQLHQMHRRFWNEETVQSFWSGKSFLRPDEGNLLSYELARILVDHLSRDWETFKAFAVQAQLDDAGHEAATRLLGVDLGKTVCALFDLRSAGSWTPEPTRWEAQPERGAF